MGSRPWEWGWCLVPSMEKGFDRVKNRMSLFFVESPDFFFMGLQISFTRGWQFCNYLSSFPQLGWVCSHKLLNFTILNHSVYMYNNLRISNYLNNNSSMSISDYTLLKQWMILFSLYIFLRLCCSKLKRMGQTRKRWRQTALSLT